jgi:predicted dehydrogenase
MQRVAIIGAGGMAGTHGASYGKIPNAKPVAVVDVDPEAAKKLADTIGAEAFTDFDRMIAEANPDIVDVCTPTNFHKGYVLQAAKAGKHVICEKPMAPSLADCREMIDATKSAGVKFMVAHVLRFFPEYAALKAQVDAGAVGKPAVIRSTRGGSFPGRWYLNAEQSGGVCLDLILHDFDWLLWTFGPAERVYAKGLTPRLKELGMDYALVTIRFKSGAIAHVEGNWAYSTRGWATSVEIAGDKGLLDVSNAQSISLITNKKSEDGKREFIPESPTTVAPYAAELQHFIDCVESGTEPSITPESSFRAVEIAVSAVESMRTGQPVQVGG